MRIPLARVRRWIRRLHKGKTPYQLKCEVRKKNLPMIGQKSIIFFPTNGVGFGHFTRLFAIARRIRKIDHSIQVLFFTTMPTLHLLSAEGIPAYHIPDRKKLIDMTPAQWNDLAHDSLTRMFDLHLPSMFVFDGTFPYRGMLNAISERDDITKVWVHRERIKKTLIDIPKERIEHFDIIINPSDSISVDPVLNSLEVEIVKCEPIIFADHEDLLSRTNVRKFLSIPEDAIVVYIQLGAGKINDINSQIGITMAELRKHKNVYVVIGESMLGDRMELTGDRIRILRDYPNSRYYHGFDFSVMAGGYNSYHEVIQFGLPTLCYPNLKTAKDDQLKRVQVAEDLDCMIVLTEVDQGTVQKSIKRLLDPAQRNRMRLNMSELRVRSSQNCKFSNGADEMAQYLIKKINGNNHT